MMTQRNPDVERIDFPAHVHAFAKALCMVLPGLLCLAAGTMATSAAEQPMEEKQPFVSERHAYRRGEEIVLGFRTNASHVLFDVDGLLPQTVRVTDGTARYVIPADLLRSSAYTVRAQPLQDGKPMGERSTFPLTISPQRNPQRYPLWHWGSVHGRSLEYWAQRGFNGFRFGTVNAPLPDRDPAIPQMLEVLEQGTRLGADIGVHFHPLEWPGWEKAEALQCLVPAGKRDPEKVYPLEPDVMQHAQKTVTSWLQRFADHPAFRHALLSSEHEIPFCLNAETRKRARQEVNLDLGQYFRAGAFRTKWGLVNPASLSRPLAPLHGVIADDHPVYRLLTWWRQRGNGVRTLNAMMADIIHAKRPDVLTWHDPYRFSPVYGTHTGLEAISTWTYGHPDIKRLSYTRVLQAAAKKDALKVMQTITLFVYGRFVMPVAKSAAELRRDQPDDTPSFTNTPEYVREALWLVFSQRPDMISIYYAGKLRPDNAAMSSAVTSPETFDAIGDVSRTLIEPYGPAMLQSQPQKAKAAVLLSAAALWFRQNPQWQGYPNESVLPFCILLMMNHVPFDIVLDEDIADGRLSDYDLLMIPYGDALTHTVHRKIVDFAKSGKKVIADTTLQAQIPGVHLVDMDFGFMKLIDGGALQKGRSMTADDYQTRMEEFALQLKPLLANIPRPARSDSQRVLLNEVTSGDVRYVFVINDMKAYGPRFGQWKLVKELGVQQGTELFIRVNGKPVIYDALSRTPVAHTVSDATARFTMTLPPAQGKLLAILPRAIQQVNIAAPASVDRGHKSALSIRVVDPAGVPLSGSIPLRIEITDPMGHKTEYSRYAATTFSHEKGWEMSMDFLPALNDLPGEWTVTISELLSGKTAIHKLSVM